MTHAARDRGRHAPFQPAIPASRSARIIDSMTARRFGSAGSSGETGLPEPEFEQRGNQFVVTLWRDWLTDEVLANLNLNERQLKAVAYIKRAGKIANSKYQQLTGATRKTATRDLDELVGKDIFIRVGEKRGSHYILTGKK